MNERELESRKCMARPQKNDDGSRTGFLHDSPEEHSQQAAMTRNNARSSNTRQAGHISVQQSAIAPQSAAAQRSATTPQSTAAHQSATAQKSTPQLARGLRETRNAKEPTAPTSTSAERAQTQSTLPRRRKLFTHSPKHPPLSDSEKPLDLRHRERSKTLSIIDGSLYSLSAGVTGNFTSAFAIAMGASNMIIGLVATLPNLIAAFAQLGVQHTRRAFRSRKQHIVFFAAVQACMWLPLIFVPSFSNSGWWLLLFMTLNATAGMLIGPVWNSYMSDIVEEDTRGRFFGKRNMISGLSAFLSTLFAGWILYELRTTPFVAFGILFGLAFVFRALSAYCLARMDDPPEKGLGVDTPDPIELAMNAERTPLGRFTIFLMLFNFAVFVASPFFAVYQLSILKFDYVTFTLLASASAISSFLTMLIWGRYVDRLGSRNVLVCCGFMIPLVPLLWGLIVDPWKLAMVEVFSGIVWAGFSLSVSTYLFDATNRKDRTRQMAEYTLLVQLAMFVGAITGTGLLRIFVSAKAHAFTTVFFVSAGLRLLMVALFFQTLRELRIVEVPIRGRLFKRFVAIRPHQGIVYEPAIESPPEAGVLAREDPREIREQIGAFARHARGGSKKQDSQMKSLERSEDEQDTKTFLSKLKRR